MKCVLTEVVLFSCCVCVLGHVLIGSEPDLLTNCLWEFRQGTKVNWWNFEVKAHSPDDTKYGFKNSVILKVMRSKCQGHYGSTVHCWVLRIVVCLVLFCSRRLFSALCETCRLHLFPLIYVSRVLVFGCQFPLWLRDCLGEYSYNWLLRHWLKTAWHR